MVKWGPSRLNKRLVEFSQKHLSQQHLDILDKKLIRNYDSSEICSRKGGKTYGFENKGGTDMDGGSSQPPQCWRFLHLVKTPVNLRRVMNR